MALDPYAACLCGSGKKFKWCCQPIHEQIAKAFDLDANGQHEAALKAIDQVAAEHRGNPEVWGRKAQLLYQMDKVEEAEATLQKAFDINPNYAFGYYLRGRFREYEGEIAGALILFRKAAELYDPTAQNIVGPLYATIADFELKLNRPGAARASLEIGARIAPTIAELHQGVKALEEDAHLPPAARKAYRFAGVGAGAPAERRAAWDQALAAAATGKLADAAAAFTQLTGQDAQDAAAWHNLALCRAWQGDHAAAIDALDHYVSLETDEGKAGEAWALAEVLRLGQGMEDQADYVVHTRLAPLQDPRFFVQAINALGEEGRLVNVRVDEQNGVITGVILEKVQALTPELAAQKAPRLGAHFMLLRNLLNLTNVDVGVLDQLMSELQPRLGPLLGGGVQSGRAPAQFSHVLSEALIFPRTQDNAEAEKQIEAALVRYVEEEWVSRPLKLLGGVSPLDAAGHATLRKKLRGVVHFLAEIAKINNFDYDFDRLRRKLGLIESAPTPAGEVPADISALGVAELTALDVAKLSHEQTEEAYQTALRLDARELAGRLAQALVSRPPSPARPDRYPWYVHLIQLAQAVGDTDAALAHLNEGEKHDCEHNEGRRRNDYELRRAQIHARRGELDQAQDAFERLIARAPAEPRFRVSAAEAMLSAKQGARALRFAEDGLTLARKQNNRDSEQHFLELVAAAKKQAG